MLRQYHPPRGRYVTLCGANISKTVMAGSIGVGAIIYIQDARASRHDDPQHREPWIVEAWLPRVIGASRRGRDGRYESTYAAGGHLASIRSLRTGRRSVATDHMLRWCDDNGWTKD